MSTTTSSSPQAALSLPTGGGAVKGIGETFQANLFSGTANYSIPIALSRRSGSGRAPLGCSSGNGNSVAAFGRNWRTRSFEFCVGAAPPRRVRVREVTTTPVATLKVASAAISAAAIPGQ